MPCDPSMGWILLFFYAFHPLKGLTVSEKWPSKNKTRQTEWIGYVLFTLILLFSSFGGISLPEYPTT
jgi:hypothetical protein